MIVSGEPGEAEVQEEDHDVTQTEVADGDIMDGEAETDSVVIAGQPEVLSSQEMQVGRQISQHTPFAALNQNPQVMWVGEYFGSLPQCCLLCKGAQMMYLVDAQQMYLDCIK